MVTLSLSDDDGGGASRSLASATVGDRLIVGAIIAAADQTRHRSALLLGRPTRGRMLRGGITGARHDVAHVMGLGRMSRRLTTRETIIFAARSKDVGLGASRIRARYFHILI